MFRFLLLKTIGEKTTEGILYPYSVCVLNCIQGILYPYLLIFYLHHSEIVAAVLWQEFGLCTETWLFTETGLFTESIWTLLSVVNHDSLLEQFAAG